MNGIGVECTHRVKDRNNNAPKTIAAKLSSFKGKEYIIKNDNKLKGTDFDINENNSKETLAISD